LPASGLGRYRAWMASTRIARHVKAPRTAVYAALLDPDAVARWRFPEGMSCTVHSFDAREGGVFRVSLTYDAPTGTGKSDAQTDTYGGRFLRLVPEREVVEAIEFETDDPELTGEMTITTTLADAGDGTDIVAVHEGIPPGVPPEQNEIGTRMALDKLAALVEQPS
jgi:uncharacterized protein YndB with AHSA1/START domain